MREPCASIVVPLLGQRTDWLEECLHSAIGQTVPCEVLVITSPRTPASNLEALARLSREHALLKVLERPTGAAFAGAINHGFAMAHCDRVGLLLSDDWLLPDTLEACLEESADIVSTGHRGFDSEAGRELWCRRLDRNRYDALVTLEQKADYLTHFFLFRRSLLLDVGGVDPDIGLTGADDYDLPWTLLEAGASVALLSEPRYCYRDHREQRLTLRDSEQQVSDLRRLLAKHGLGQDEIDRLVEAKARWYGRPVSEVMAADD